MPASDHASARAKHGSSCSRDSTVSAPAGDFWIKKPPSRKRSSTRANHTARPMYPQPVGLVNDANFIHAARLLAPLPPILPPPFAPVFTSWPYHHNRSPAKPTPQAPLTACSLLSPQHCPVNHNHRGDEPDLQNYATMWLVQDQELGRHLTRVYCLPGSSLGLGSPVQHQIIQMKMSKVSVRFCEPQ